ncbi:MAG: hypothetical protein L0K65_01345, partial [Actinomyces sp.]|nr:hypothetical protein [Actinomyces sp.]
LALYRARHGQGEGLSDFLERVAFADTASTTVRPDPGDVAGFQTFMERYRADLPVARSAGQAYSVSGS